jgi:mannosyltransferase
MGRYDKLLRIAACLALVAGLAATLKAFISLDGFWEDEFFPITFINEPFPSFFVAVARLDQHPFLYFLQVKVWALLFSGDKGLLLNSVAWHLVSCLAIFFVGRAWLGVATGLLAAAVYAVVPQVVWASVTLRAYSMIPALAVGAWWLNVRVLSGPETPWRRWAALAAIELALGYSHAIALYFVGWVALAAAMQVLGEQRSAAPWKRWFLIQICIGLLILPVPISALMRESGPGNSDGGSAIFYLGTMVAGWGMKSVAGLALGTALYAMAIVLGLREPKTRALTIGLLIGPVALAMIVSSFLIPMFKTPVYSAMIMPFASLALAGGLLALKGNWGPRIAIILLAVMSLAVIPVSQILLERSSPWQPVSAELKRLTQPGDVVVVAKPFAYWAVLRYAVGPNWGSPLEIMPLRPSAAVGRLLELLGPKISETLKLVPKTNHIVHGGVTYVIGDDAVRDTGNAKRVWVVHRLRYPIPVRLAEGFRDQGIVARYGDREPVEVQLFDRRTD